MKTMIILLATMLMIGAGCSSTNEGTVDVQERTASGYVEYRNEEFNFSFLYPEDWDLIDLQDTRSGENGAVVAIQTPDTRELIENRQLPPDSEYNFLVSRWDDINNKYAQAGGGVDSRYDYENLEEYLNDDVFRMVQMQGETVVDGVQAYEVIVGGYGAYYGIMFEHDGGLYQLLFPRNSDNQLSEEESEVLDSFTLLER